MKTCIYCGRTYPEDIRVCPACGLNLEQAPENIMGAIEIDIEPEEWIPPQRAEPEQAAAEALSPELMRMFRGNQYMYVFRMLLLTVIGLCFLVNCWVDSFYDIVDFIGLSLVTAVPALLGGLRGLWRSLARLRKTPGELAAQVSASPRGATSLFSAHERIVLKAPILGILLSAGALYAAYLILSNTPLRHLAYNLRLLGRFGSEEWRYILDRASGGIACITILIFCLSYPIRTIRLFMLRGKVIKTP